MSNLFEVFLLIIRKLEDQKIPYMIVGSVASMVYGEPRLTHDMDLVIDMLPRDATRLEELFPLEDFYCPPEEVIVSEVIHRGQFNLIHHESGLKIDLMVRKETQHAVCEFARRCRMPFLKGVEVFIATPEDVIIKKLEFYRQGGSSKHLSDIRGILAQTDVDEGYLTNWITQLGLGDEWKKVK